MHTVSSRWHKPKSKSKRRQEISLRLSAARWKSTGITGNNHGDDQNGNIVESPRNESPSTSQSLVHEGNINSKSVDKLGLFQKHAHESRPNIHPPGSEYILIHSSALDELVKNLNCSECGEATLTIQVRERHGLACKLCVKCTRCGFCPTQTYSCPRVKSDSKSQRPPFDVNRKNVDAFLSLGVGHRGMEKFCAAMGMHSMDSKTFTKHMTILAAQAKLLKEDCLSQSRQIVRRAYGTVDGNTGSNTVVDISVSYDGTWHKRGHTSAYGIGIVIDLLTGLVIDYEILSKHCTMCVISTAELGADTPEFHVWHACHVKSAECEKNHEGSSVAMEMCAAEILWKRSVTNFQMRYTTILSDGDSKTFNHLISKSVYGSSTSTVLKKEECVNHVAKRMGTGLRQVVQTWKLKGVQLGGRTGGLTNATITKLTNYYRNALVQNIPNIADMKKAVYATLCHYMSTDSKPQHKKCPEGTESWCFYNQSIAAGKTPQSHDKMTVKLSEPLVVKIIPVYQRLASDELLSRCIRGATQNQNESLHSVIWRKCPKETFISRRRLEIAVCNAVAEFNMGCSATKELKSGIRQTSVSHITAQALERFDSRRKYESLRSSMEKRKACRRKVKLTKMKKEAAKQKKEGVTYAAGQF